MFIRLRTPSIVVSATACFLSVLSSAFAQMRLNEVLADNRSSVAHAGGFPDYVELHNTSNAPVSLTGWSLSDDPALPQKFVFPSGVTISADGFLIVWADANTGAPGLHTGFGLGAKGDQLSLRNASGDLQDELQFGIQTADRSLGRLPDGSGAWALNDPSAGASNTRATLGDPGLLRLNEWMARPASGDDWLEVFNAAFLPVALGGLVLTDQASGAPANRAVPTHSFIGARSPIQFFASDLAQLDADHLDFRLSSDSETLTLHAANRSKVLDCISYGSQSQNISQGRAPDGGDQIIYFPAGSATPGASNFRELTNVIISEVLTHSDPPFEDAIELQDVSSFPVDISYWWLSDSGSQPRKYRIPSGTVIPANGFRVFYHAQFGAGASGFALDSVEGDEVYLASGNAAGELTGELMLVRFGALANGISAGRFVTAAGVDFVPLAARTFGVNAPATVVQFRQGTGASNAPPRISSIVINEIHFQPAGGGEEFLELHNPTSLPARLFDPLYPTNGWRIRDGIAFDFPSSLTIPAGGFLLVVGFDPTANPAQLAAFRAGYNLPPEVPVIGPYTGRLSDTGKVVELLEPDTPQGPEHSDPGFVPYMQAERVRFGVSAPWPAAASGQSLQRRVASQYGNDPANWASSLPTAGRANVMDTDADGLPDDWEDTYSLDRTSSDDADDDTDGDGMSNVCEFQSGTHPRNAQSVFAFGPTSIDGGVLRLQFHAEAGRTYGLQQSEATNERTWTAITNFPSASQATLRILKLPISTNTVRVLRLVTPAQP